MPTPVRLALLALATWLAACANPVAPTGGPPDTTPPALVASVPDTGAVNVTSSLVSLTFSEGVDRTSLARALTVTPEPERRPEVRWDGRTATLDLGPLRANTTYLLTLDNTLRDLHGVALATPLTLAFATGPTLDRGRLAGRVLLAATGAAAAGVDVLAFASSDTLDRPLYRTQTGPDGRFAFDYLGAGPFYVLALQDVNRNRRPDAGEAFAVPPAAALRPDTLAVATPWWLVRPDTTGPRPERVLTLSTTRLSVRYDEPLRLASRDTSAWTLTDTTGVRIPVEAVFTTGPASREVWLRTAPLTRPATLVPGPVLDSLGQRGPTPELAVRPGTSADTTRLRLVRFTGDTLVVSAPLPDTLRPSATDTSGLPRPVELTTENGTTYAIRVERPARVGLDLRPFGVDSTANVLLAARPEDTGGLVGRVDTAGVAVQVEAIGPVRRAVQAGADGAFTFTSLPAGSYRLRAFVDRDGDGRWNPGQPSPFVPAEPLVWRQEAVQVRARWDTEVPDPLTFSPVP